MEIKEKERESKKFYQKKFEWKNNIYIFLK